MLAVLTFFLISGGLYILVNHVGAKIAYKNEIKARKRRFEASLSDQDEPFSTFEFLNEGLTGKKPVEPTAEGRQYQIALEDLRISQDDLHEAIKFTLSRCWTSLNRRVPMAKEAFNGKTYIKLEVGRLSSWMKRHRLTAEELGVDIEAVKANYLIRCRTVLEQSLATYPGKRWDNMSAPQMCRTLIELWEHPTPEQIKTWEGYVVEAKTRHAQRYLRRLREGRYTFPQTNERVNRVYDFLKKAGKNPEDIGTSHEELDVLRGHLTTTRS